MDKLQLSIRWLTDLGFYTQHSGFAYLASAIELVSKDPISFYARRTNLIDVLSREYDVTPSCLRRSMSYAIRAAWFSKRSETFKSFFPDCKEDYPPPMIEFIFRIAVERLLSEPHETDLDDVAVVFKTPRAVRRCNDPSVL